MSDSVGICSSGAGGQLSWWTASFPHEQNPGSVSSTVLGRMIRNSRSPSIACEFRCRPAVPLYLHLLACGQTSEPLPLVVSLAFKENARMFSKHTLYHFTFVLFLLCSVCLALNCPLELAEGVGEGIYKQVCITTAPSRLCVNTLMSCLLHLV